MQQQARRRAAQAGTSPVRGTKPLSRRGRAAHTSEPNATTDVLTLALPTALSLPSLKNVRQRYELRRDDPTLVAVSQAFIAARLLTTEDWEASKCNLVKFLERGINVLSLNEGILHTADQIELHYGMSDRDSIYRHMDRGNLAFTIDIGNCGWFRVGNLLNALEDECAGLGTAFYMVLERSLESFCDVFEYQRASYQVEGMAEMAAEENGVECYADMSEEQKAQYYIWDVDESVPARCLPYIKDYRTAPKHPERVLRANRTGAHSQHIELVLKLAATVKLYRRFRGDRPDDAILPSWIIWFQDNDGVNASFDEYAQTAYEGDASEVYVKSFDPKSPLSIQQAIKSFRIVSRLYATAGQLSKLINGDE